eukprot:TRINITY_DN20496_c0_g1_i1.p1 TRINITY_DN20496_c0_g1~~TRINITY_DN20496_c0_g1_i1.p1  ORF type:complete len:202 (+),score=18.99 TRINITY_DN20496_c0_g1_i1:129-734(+)
MSSSVPVASAEQVRKKWDALLNVINNVSGDGDIAENPPPLGSTLGKTAGDTAASPSPGAAEAARDLLAVSGSLKSTRRPPRSSKNQWDDRHHLLFSAVNDNLQRNTRAYFDRPRDIEHYGLKPKELLRTTWSLDTPENPEAVQKVPKEPPSPASSKRMSKSASSPAVGDWNPRHQVMFNKDNRHYHPNFREYFERPRSLRY